MQNPEMPAVTIDGAPVIKASGLSDQAKVNPEELTVNLTKPPGIPELSTACGIISQSTDPCGGTSSKMIIDISDSESLDLSLVFTPEEEERLLQDSQEVVPLVGRARLDDPTKKSKKAEKRARQRLAKSQLREPDETGNSHCQNEQGYSTTSGTAHGGGHGSGQGSGDIREKGHGSGITRGSGTLNKCQNGNDRGSANRGNGSSKLCGKGQESGISRGTDPGSKLASGSGSNSGGGNAGGSGSGSGSGSKSGSQQGNQPKVNPKKAGKTKLPTEASGGSGSNVGLTRGSEGADKRKRSDASTPPGQPMKKKGAKRPSYSDVVKSDNTVLIKREGAAFDRAALDLLLNALCIELDKIQQGAEKPTFESNSISNGLAKFVCSNKQSCDWLRQNIAVVDSIGNMKLSTMTADALHSRPKVRLFVPFSSRTQASVLNDLKAQNTGLNTDSWCHVRTYECTNSKCNVLVFSMDEESAEFIRRKRSRLHYLFSTIPARVQGGKPNTNSNPGSKE